MTERQQRLPAAVRLLALFAFEIAAVVGLHQLGRYRWMRVDWNDLGRWLDEAAPEDALLAATRTLALVLAWWLLVSTAVYVVAALARAPHAVRRLRWALVPGVGRLLDGLLALSITGSAVLADAPVAVAEPVGVTVLDQRPSSDRSALPPDSAAVRRAIYVASGPLPAPSADARVHEVSAGESLWTIAEDELGDPTRWVEIWRLNRGRLATAGFDDPNVLRIGWQLVLPGGRPAEGPGVEEPRTHVVQAGETLAEIAGDELGDPGRAGEIAQLNSLADPDLIYPGWHLTLPGTADAGDANATGRRAPSRGPEPAPGNEAAPAEPAPETESTTPSAPGERTPSSTATADDDRADRDGGDDDDEDASSPAVPLLGAAGTVLAVGVLRELRRRWSRRSAVRPSADVPPSPPAQGLPTLRDVLVLADEPAVDRLDAVLAQLASALRPRSGEPCPQPRLVQVGADRIDVLLDRPYPSPPPPWRPEASGLTWVLDADASVQLGPVDNPVLPALVTVGVGDADLLVDLEAHGVVSLVGDEAACAGLARSLVAELVTRSEGTVAVEIVGDALGDSTDGFDAVHRVASWDSVDIDLITGSTRMLDAGEWPHTFAARASGRVYDGWAPTVWITAPPDDPRGVDAIEAVAARPGTGSAVVVIGGDAGRGLRIEVDAGGRFHIPALGLSGRTQALDSEATSQLAALLEDPGPPSEEPGEPAVLTPADEPDDTPGNGHRAAVGRSAEDAPYEDPPFDVLVRLCGDVTIEGAHYMLPPREAAVAAYVALRGRVDLDQIRDAVWCGAGVSRKRVQNVVSTIRQSIGDAIAFEGESRLVANPTLTTDVELIRRRLAYARQQKDVNRRVQALRGGLEFVRGRVCTYAPRVRRNWIWLDHEDWITHIESLVAALGWELANAYVELGDGAGACWAARHTMDAVGRRDDLTVLLVRGYELEGDEAAARSTLRSYERYLDDLGVDEPSEDLLAVLDRYHVSSHPHPDG